MAAFNSDQPAADEKAAIALPNITLFLQHWAPICNAAIERAAALADDHTVKRQLVAVCKLAALALQEAHKIFNFAVTESQSADMQRLCRYGMIMTLATSNISLTLSSYIKLDRDALALACFKKRLHLKLALLLVAGRPFSAPSIAESRIVLAGLGKNAQATNCTEARWEDCASEQHIVAAGTAGL